MTHVAEATKVTGRMSVSVVSLGLSNVSLGFQIIYRWYQQGSSPECSLALVQSLLRRVIARPNFNCHNLAWCTLSIVTSFNVLYCGWFACSADTLVT